MDAALDAVSENPAVSYYIVILLIANERYIYITM